jgi:hypothetical protein
MQEWQEPSDNHSEAAPSTRHNPCIRFTRRSLHHLLCAVLTCLLAEWQLSRPIPHFSSAREETVSRPIRRLVGHHTRLQDRENLLTQPHRWDKQERRNYGEAVHEDNDILGIFSPEEYTHFTPAWGGVLIVRIAPVLSAAGCVCTNDPRVASLPPSAPSAIPLLKSIPTE